MAFNSTSIMPDANNITVTTRLTSCDNTTLDLNRTIYILQNLYRSNITNLFFNGLIINFNCTKGIENYFQQIITFTQTISIRIQILFASLYFDYINANNYQLNGFIIDRETFFNLSSITINNSVTSNACSSAEVAQDPLCLTNTTNSVCIELSNPWTFTCSQQFSTIPTSLIGSTAINVTTMMSSRLKSWQVGLICGFSVLFVLLLILLSAFFYRRCRHSKQMTLSSLNLYDDVKRIQTIGIPQDQAFQRAAMILQQKRSNHTATSWIHDGTATNIARNDNDYTNLKSSEPYNQVTFVDHTKVHDPGLPSDIPEKSMTSVDVPTSPPDRIVSVSETAMNQLKLRTDEIEEDKRNEFDNISIDQCMSSSPRKSSTSVLRQFTNLSSFDESLHDEDAWMSILDVVNVELAILNGQDRIRTLM